MTTYCSFDKTGRLALTVIANTRIDAERATDLGCDPTLAPYRIERFPMSVGRAALADWQVNVTTDKAVDVTTNIGWDEL